MKRTIQILSVAAAAGFIFALCGCNDEIVPNKAQVDAMNKQRGAMSKNLPNGGAPGGAPMTAEQATGNKPAPSGGQR